MILRQLLRILLASKTTRQRHMAAVQGALRQEFIAYVGQCQSEIRSAELRDQLDVEVIGLAQVMAERELLLIGELPPVGTSVIAGDHL
jgi:hypothetical protein